MVVVTLDLPWPRPITEKAVAAEAAPHRPALKKPVAVMVSQRHEYGRFVLQLTIKAYVVDVRLERVMANDIAERTLEALEAQQTLRADALAGQLTRRSRSAWRATQTPKAATQRLRTAPEAEGLPFSGIDQHQSAG